MTKKDHFQIIIGKKVVEMHQITTQMMEAIRKDIIVEREKTFFGCRT